MKEDRLALLKERVQAEYDQFLRTVSFEENDIVETARKIIYMEEALNLIKGNAYNYLPEVEVLLYYEHPLAEFYQCLDPADEGFTLAVHDEMDCFLMEKQKSLSWLAMHPDTLSPEETEKISEFTKRRDTLFEEEKQERKEYLAEIYRKVERDYKEALSYLERYETLRGKPNEEYAKGIQAVHEQMMQLELWSTVELSVLSRVEEPLMMVYQCFKEIINGNPESRKNINEAIYGTVWARIDMERSMQKGMDRKVEEKAEEETEDEMEL